ncbi:MAG: Asp-tRNA(Asn)/Glu-tRNA(Gln) amidotransferase subunit GatC [Burkholderiales bacterium]|jgi:aspartyl-tRNA(Asn)/glutamyl-tRNA(Gln) amidotransferase subunit C|nr:Asp-tRNA(Asn)/Glu-tRNA(Gln) amidotransferase subunit GatC [Betaproteobacteria bacterium]MBT7427027.1 Asp-tRNA(Asn)/Glu-tRNA(Gln) amidotransferase subunit GatC [Betaproteobacteria bacterium]MBT7997967.1 Asp-tRNA(Asn)/Glu-tRNA(Gln) amidotransferase subunit GatC [Betaproteobacteria bacterium]MDG1163060.1 Asp-tRNA(Asn)/Glu-tRNA(Gln) amidotransferase subunit GatC [Burkholderiales bacterium]MDG2202268.1 Asp-tRNA(Asn)/Glu-tRNA(Gln) amidotransferase subunit GatC [Burkholderiales bacterium]|tara:strand:- start:90 stop:377 length:288 start_codon:yes stop_codon:yes gene_type:complete
MPLNKQDVKKAADLARIAISDDEAEAALAPLKQVFTLIEQMQTQDTDGVEPMAHAQDISSRLREDIVTETDKREALQASAPATEKGLFLVPKVID